MAQKSNRFFNAQNVGPLLSVLLLAPMAMAPKGCSAGTVGDDCPATMPCGEAGSKGSGGSGTMGAAGSTTTAGSTSIAGTSSMGTGGGSTGVTCGGLLPTPCAASDYCAYPIGAMCGAADQGGTCQPRPQTCDDIYAPVCGCDGKTYPSECVAASTGISVRSMGTCDGNTGSGGSGGSGSGSGKTCGPLIASTCGMGEFCDFAVGKCLIQNEIGTCTALPQGCTDIYAPVCGCDGKTYPSECAAAQVGVSVASMGECSTGGGGGAGGGSGTGTTCGGLTGASCVTGEYCYYSLMAACGAADATGTCTKIPGACDAIYSPVCGCDGHTYGNDCTAAAAGVSVSTVGACK